MLGAITGDIVGSIFEFSPTKTKDFPFFQPGCRFTDDTVMTAAVAAACLEYLAAGQDYEVFSKTVTAKMREFGRRHFNAGYGGMFKRWLMSDDMPPYNSFGNGSAMRVSPVGWAAQSLSEALSLAELSALPTHNHPEGVKGAQAAAACLYLARTGASKDEIRKYVRDNFYPLDFTIDAIRPGYSFDVTCSGSVPQAIESFLESSDYADAVRTAVSLGGDSDTIGAITGGIAEAFYGVPDDIKDGALAYLSDDIVEVYNKFCAAIG